MLGLPKFVRYDWEQIDITSFVVNGNEGLKYLFVITDFLVT